MEIQILPYSEEHRDALMRIFLQARLTAFPWVNADRFNLKDFDLETEGEEILVARTDNLPIGFVSWWAPENFVHHLFVDPDHIGKGVGGLLLRECLKNIGRPARLKCLIENKNAMAFYEHLGWQLLSTGHSENGDYALLVFE